MIKGDIRMRIAVSGGGTGGHIYPALAFIKEVQRRHPDVEFLYIGTENGLEKKLLNGKISRSAPLKLQVSNENFLLKM